MYFGKTWFICLFLMVALGGFSAKQLSPTLARLENNVNCLDNHPDIATRQLASVISPECVTFKQNIHQKVRQIQKQNKQYYK